MATTPCCRPSSRPKSTDLRGDCGLSDDEEQAVLAQRVKQHRQSIDGFRQGKRDDLVQMEEAQLAIDEAYLPEQLDDGAVEEAVQAAIRESGAQSARDQGKVMALLSARLRGRADMKAVVGARAGAAGEPIGLMAGRVADKIAMVVGGGQTPGETIGNGRAMALLLAREGARVVVADRSLASAEDTVAMITAEGGEAIACAADVTDEADVKRLIDAAVDAATATSTSCTTTSAPASRWATRGPTR